LWLRLATVRTVTISHVRGKANAGGIGFVAASDIVLADETAQFSLSELLFGLYPACVLPFLIRPHWVSEGARSHVDDPADFGETSLRMGTGGCL